MQLKQNDNNIVHMSHQGVAHTMLTFVFFVLSVLVLIITTHASALSQPVV